MVAPKMQLLMAIGVALNVVQADPISHNNMAICTTRQCRQTAASILADIDPLADPCQDFSKFTCGGFEEKVDIPSDATSVSRYTLVQMNNDRIVRSIVDALLGKSLKPARGNVADQRNIKKLQNLFSSCMDEASILKAGRKPLADEIQKVILAFPASGSPADKIGLSKALGHLNRLGLQVPSFLTLDSSSDLENPLVNVLKAYETGLDTKMGAIPEYYQNQELLQRYQDTVATMFQTILGDEDVANRIQPLGPKDVTREWSNVAKGVVDFELQLVEILNFQPETNDPSQYNRPLTVEQLSGLTPSIDWTLLLQETLPASVKYTRPIVVSFVPYLTKIDGLLQNTPASALQYYFSWLLIRNHVENLASIYNEPWVAFQSVISGVPADAKAERFKTCIAMINNNLDYLIGHYFVRETFKGNSRKEVMAIINNLVSTYEKNFNDTAWLDQTTRDRAIKKLKAIALAVGYATHDPDATSSKALDAYYKDYNVVASDYFGNQINYHTWAATRSYFKLLLPFNREEMNEHVTTASANNAFFYNAVSIPAGFIQDPVFNLENPEYVNYGGIGLLSAHEIGHAFDSIGCKFDYLGRYTNWLTESTSQIFTEKAQCFVEQYGNFTIKGPGNKDYNLDGKRTLSENFSDNSALKIAFHTWQNRLKSDPSGRKIKNFKLPGLEKYTAEQLFFISVGRFWCQKMTPEALLDYSRTDLHSPYKWRANGVVQNSPEFAKAFNCPVGSPMNPVKKCAVW